MTHKKYTRVQRAANQAIRRNMPLDAHTPLGLFESNRGDRYLVIDDEEGRLAIALRHRKRRPFSWSILSERAIATGNWLGNCELELTHRSVRDTSTQEVGTLGIDEFSASLLCRHQGTNNHWRPLADVPLSDPLTEYDGWRLMKGGIVFFEQLPNCATFPSAFPMSFGSSSRP